MWYNVGMKTRRCLLAVLHAVLDFVRPLAVWAIGGHFAVEAVKAVMAGLVKILK